MASRPKREQLESGEGLGDTESVFVRLDRIRSHEDDGSDTVSIRIAVIDRAYERDPVEREGNLFWFPVLKRNTFIPRHLQ